MGFVRAWWPPVVLGLVGAFLGIGVVEVAGMPAPGTSNAADGPRRPAPRPATVAPAAIERDGDVADLPRQPPVAMPRMTSHPRRPVATRVPTAAPTPTPSRTPSPTLPEPKATPSSVPVPVPVPRVAPTVRPTPTATRRPQPSTLPPAPVRPAHVLDLRRWKLTLPAGRRGHPLEYRQPVLGSLANGTYLRLTPDRGVAFRAPVGGATTANSSYPRAELREMSADGRREAGWSNSTGRHVMTISQAITATPRAKPHVVAGQIHDAEDDVAMIRLEGRRLFVESDGDDVGLLDPAYRLGTRFTVSIIATRHGIGVVYNGRRTVRLAEVGRGWYFKAGCYPQSNPERGDRPTAYGEVVIYALTVRHLRS